MNNTWYIHFYLVFQKRETTPLAVLLKLMSNSFYNMEQVQMLRSKTWNIYTE